MQVVISMQHTLKMFVCGVGSIMWRFSVKNWEAQKIKIRTKADFYNIKRSDNYLSFGEDEDFEGVLGAALLLTFESACASFFKPDSFLEFMFLD
jgi:hypothetical protein